MASPEFTSAAEFRAVMDQIFTMMSTDEAIGPALRDADVSRRFSFEDVALIVNVRATRDGETGNLLWTWSDDIDWEPQVRMAMTSQIANKYFQGRENIAMAIARRRIRTGGDVKAALEILPLTKPVFARYRDLVQREYPHLEA